MSKFCQKGSFPILWPIYIDLVYSSGSSYHLWYSNDSFILHWYSNYISGIPVHPVFRPLECRDTRFTTSIPLLFPVASLQSLDFHWYSSGFGIHWYSSVYFPAYLPLSLKFGHAKNNCNYAKILTVWFYQGVQHPKDAKRDSGKVWVYTVCQDLQKISHYSNNFMACILVIDCHNFVCMQKVLGCIMRKPVHAIRKQQRRRSACAFTQSDQPLCCLLPTQYNKYTW